MAPRSNFQSESRWLPQEGGRRATTRVLYHDFADCAAVAAHLSANEPKPRQSLLSTALALYSPDGLQAERACKNPSTEPSQGGRLRRGRRSRGKADIVRDGPDLLALVPSAARGERYWFGQGIARYRRKASDVCGPNDGRSRGIDPSKVHDGRTIRGTTLEGVKPTF